MRQVDRWNGKVLLTEFAENDKLRVLGVIHVPDTTWSYIDDARTAFVVTVLTGEIWINGQTYTTGQECRIEANDVATMSSAKPSSFIIKHE